MAARSLLVAIALLAIPAPAIAADGAANVIPVPALRAKVSVSSDVVRIGDMIDNAGSAAQIAIYRAPDLGTTGTLPATQVLNVLRAHQVIGVDTKGISKIAVTRLARTLDADDIELQVAVALEHRKGLGDAKDLSLTFDNDLRTVRLDAANNGSINAVATRFDPRNGRFDVTLEVGNDQGSAQARLRFTGTAVETVESAVLARDVDRNTLLRLSDFVMERRPKAEVGSGLASRDQIVGMQARHQLRAGQALHSADLTKPDLVQHDQPVTLIFQAGGIYLTVRGKATESGTEGDIVNVLNMQSKRVVSGVVVGRGRVSISPVPPRTLASAAPVPESAAPASRVAISESAPVPSDNNAPVSPKAE